MYHFNDDIVHKKCHIFGIWSVGLVHVQFPRYVIDYLTNPNIFQIFIIRTTTGCEWYAGGCGEGIWARSLLRALRCVLVVAWPLGLCRMSGSGLLWNPAMIHKTISLYVDGIFYYQNWILWYYMMWYGGITALCDGCALTLDCVERPNLAYCETLHSRSNNIYSFSIVKFQICLCL